MERIPGEWDILDRQSSLTDKQKLLIQDSWAKLFQNGDDIGVAILIRLFMNFPSAKQYFDQFRHMKERKEMEESGQFRKHAARLTNAINTMVENLNNKEKLASVMKLTATSHALRHKVDPVYFKVVSGVILELLGEVFPEVVTPEVATAWTNFFAMMCCTFKAHYEELGWSKLTTSTGHDEGPRDKTGIVRLLHHKLCLLPFKSFNGRRSLSALNQPGDPWRYRTMCTTMMVLTTIALILRQRFSSKIKPHKDTNERDVPYTKSNGAAEARK